MEEETVASVIARPEVTPLSETGDKRKSGELTQPSKKPKIDDGSRKRFGEHATSDERKRSKRLFGSLIGTLGKFKEESSSARAQAGASRRAELEAKLAERMRQEKTALEQEAKRTSEERTKRVAAERCAELEALRRRQLLLFHDGVLARAHFLRTKAEPSLYYLPWKLSSKEQDQIDLQVADAERERNQVLEQIDESRGTTSQVIQPQDGILEAERTSKEEQLPGVTLSDQREGPQEEEREDTVKGDPETVETAKADQMEQTSCIEMSGSGADQTPMPVPASPKQGAAKRDGPQEIAGKSQSDGTE